MSTKICKLVKIGSALSKYEDRMKILKAIINFIVIIAIAFVVGKDNFEERPLPWKYPKK